jgi:hypothetical protein
MTYIGHMRNCFQIYWMNMDEENQNNKENTIGVYEFRTLQGNVQAQNVKKTLKWQ